ncbi:helix-turn-helix domain-containing protein [Nonomuraea fastidiosa]|uniref:AlbA family DNA-binding domain-containing protein n=1 Tax=Nonomuraea fastidiosa TaxID=46173 RepID=UPI003672379F
MDAQVGEAEDLDYKRELYGNGDSKRRDLCTDVAALASARGGLLILGIEEDHQGRAIRMSDVELSDTEATRMHQVIGSGVHPLPSFEIIPVENPANPGKGCYVIAVAAGPRQPYAVAVNDGYRYPRRVGMTIGYLTEPEIETAYRRRDAARRHQSTRAREIEEATTRRLPVDRPWVIVSLVPDRPGDARLDAASYSKARASYLSSCPTVLGRSWTWKRVRLGQRRLILDDQYDNSARTANYMLSELYEDGSGTFASPSAYPYDENAKVHLFNDEALVNVIMSGLRFLGEHARERAHAAGVALLRLTIVPGQVRKRWQLYYTRGRRETLGNEADQADFETAEAATPLDELVDGPGLVAASAVLGGEIFQGFGLPEVPHITQGGQIRQCYWQGSEWWSALEEWAHRHRIELIDETIAMR